MDEKHERDYAKLRKEYVSRMTKEEKEEEVRDALTYYYTAI